MTDTESARTGYTKVYHPRGPLVSMPVIGDTPKAMFDWVTAILDAGFVIAAPGMEEGEERESINGVLRSEHERDGEVTPVLLLYSANEGMKFSMLKLYLNNDDDVKAFESACGVKLDSLPLYEGKDKPERDGGKLAQKFIHKLPKPRDVVFKQNPHYSEEEANAAKAQNKLYTKPRRVFVRWADAPVNGTPAPANLPHAEPLSEVQVAEAAWKVRLQGVVACDDLNKLIPMVKAITDQPIRSRAWTMLRECATAHKWELDAGAGKFVHLAELPVMPIPKTVEAVAKVAASAPPPPPPDDEPTDSPLIAVWKKKLIPANGNVAKLNGELLTNFKSIGKTEADRGNVWIMLTEFAQANGCEFDQSTWKFVQTAPAGVPGYPN